MGFKTEFLLETPSDDCLCSVCLGVLVDPRRLSPCGHTVCLACLPISKHVSVGRSCPVCGSQFRGRPTKLPASFTERIFSLKCRCHLGCGFEGSLKNLPRHLASDCPNSTVLCPNRKRGCDSEFLRSSMDHHMESCWYRVTTCEACGKRLFYHKLQAHQARNKCVEAKLMNETIRSEMRNSREVREHWLSIRTEQIALQSQITRLRSSRLEARRQSLSAMTNEHKRERTASSARLQKFETKSRQQRSMSAPVGSHIGKDEKQRLNLPVPRNLPIFLQPITAGVHWKTDPHSDDVMTVVSDDISLIVPSEYSSGSFSGSFVARRSVDGMMTKGSSNRTTEAVDVDMKCRQCSQIYKEQNNHDNACCWHRELVMQFGGLTCAMCGRLSFKRGCVIGCHKPEVPEYKNGCSRDYDQQRVSYVM